MDNSDIKRSSEGEANNAYEEEGTMDDSWPASPAARRVDSGNSPKAYGRKSSYNNSPTNSHGSSVLMPSSMSELEEPYLMKQLPFELMDPLVYAIFVMGNSTVMTWGLCIMAVDDLNRRMPESNAEFESAAAYKTSSCFMAIAFFVLGGYLRFRGRIIVTLLLQTLCVAGALHFAVKQEPMGYWLVLFVIAGGAHALTQGSFSELCATAPSRYFRAFCIGLATGPVCIGGLKLLTKSIVTDPEECEKMWLLQIIILYCIAAIIYIKLIDNDDTLRVTAAVGRGPPGENDSLIPASRRITENLSEGVSSLIRRNTHKVFTKTKFWLISLLVNLIVSFIIFPGLASAADSNSKSFQKSGWFHETLFVIFLVSDFLGRFSTLIPFLQNLRPNVILIATILRVLMIPLFILLMRYDGPRGEMDDEFTYAFMVIAGVSNGILITACCVDPLSQVGIDQREVLGTFVFCFYMVGQASGVLSALGIKYAPGMIMLQIQGTGESAANAFR